MADQQDTDQDDAAQDDAVDQDAQDQVDTDQADQDEEKGFNEKQLQQMYSATGRLVKKHVEEAIAPLMERQAAPAQGDDALEKFNKDLSEQLFSGDLTGAIDKALTVRERAKANIDAQTTIDTDRAITSYSEDPLYKDIYQDMKKIAHEKRANGFPPAAAAELAFAQAKTNLYEKKDANPDDENLSMLPGGQPPRKKAGKVKLAPEFKKACERDIASGKFKDEAEYIAYLSPHVRQKYGM